MSGAGSFKTRRSHHTATGCTPGANSTERSSAGPVNRYSARVWTVPSAPIVLPSSARETAARWFKRDVDCSIARLTRTDRQLAPLPVIGVQLPRLQPARNDELRLRQAAVCDVVGDSLPYRDHSRPLRSFDHRRDENFPRV